MKKWNQGLLAATALLGVVLGREVLDLERIYRETDTALFSELYNQTLEWGMYKPNMFFGVKDRSPNPVTVGMIWGVPVSEGRMDFRHTYRY
jgi:hypothetical protein